MHRPVAAVPGVAHLGPSVAPLAHNNEIRAIVRAANSLCTGHDTQGLRRPGLSLRARRAGRDLADPVLLEARLDLAGPERPADPLDLVDPLRRPGRLDLVDPLCRPDRLDLVDLVRRADPLDLADPLCRPGPLDLADPMRVGHIPRQRASR
jgi:hypothetical protein